MNLIPLPGQSGRARHSLLAMDRKAGRGTEDGLGQRTADEPTLPPTFSVIIPAYNEEAHIGRCLASLARQQAGNSLFEVLVVDNGSTDKTPDIARRMGARVFSDPKARVAGLRNLGAALALGQFLVFLDADMEAPCDWLSRIEHYLCSDLADAVGFVDAVPDCAPWFIKTWNRRNDITQVRRADYLPTRNLAVSRKAYARVGGFDETLTTAEDKDFTMRLASTGHIVLQAPGLGLVHWGVESSLGELMRKEFWRQGSNLTLMLKHGCTLRVARFPLVSGLHLLLGLAVLTALVSGSTLLPSLAGLWIAPGLVMALARPIHGQGPAGWLLIAGLAWLRWNIAGLALVAEGVRLAWSGTRPRRWADQAGETKPDQAKPDGRTA